MSDYDYDDPPRRKTTRVRDRDPEYVRETTYVERGKGVPSRDLVYRPRDDSIEDIPRDFPPPGAEYRRSRDRYYDDDDDYYPPRQARSRRHRDSYDDDYYSDYGPAPAAAAGAAAGYAAGRARGRREKPSRDDGYYSDDYDAYERRPKPQRRKSTVEKTLEDLGLGGVVGAVTSRLRSKSRSRKNHSRSRSSSYDRQEGGRRRSRSRGGDSRQKWEQAAKAAVLAGAVEAWRARKTPGAWTGEKGQRIATAALGSAGIDALVDKNPDKKGKRHLAESVVGGLLANRAVNGPRSESRGRSRSRSRAGSSFGERLRSRSRSIFGRGGGDGSRSPSRGRGGGGAIKDLAAAGGLAAVGKAIYDRVRSKSRGRDRRDRSRSSSADSYIPYRQSRYANDRGAQPDDDYQDDRVARPRGRAGEAAAGAAGAAAGASADRGQKRDSSSSSVSTTDLENRRKRSRGKELLTAGLATVATIHAAHGVYSSMEASDKRHKLVMEGEMTPEQARKAKSKNMLQDAAAVGIAALGIKSAFSEWKEMNEQRHEVHEIEARRRRHKKQREKRQREQRQYQQQMMLANGPANPYGGAGYNGPSGYADGNPYGSVPPPPIGTGGRG